MEINQNNFQKFFKYNKKTYPSESIIAIHKVELVNFLLDNNYQIATIEFNKKIAERIVFFFFRKDGIQEAINIFLEHIK